MFDCITELFCFIDDFCNYLTENRKRLSQGNHRNPTRVPKLTEAEIVTIVLLFQMSRFKTFKDFYKYFNPNYIKFFPNMPSYERFVVLKKRVVPILVQLLQYLFVRSAKEAYIDATSIRVCNNKRINSHKVFKDFAKRGKSTMGYFFGFKLHLVTDIHGNIISFLLTEGNCDDRKPVENLLHNFKGTVYADRGYISKNLFDRLFSKGIKLVTNVKSNMKNKLVSLQEKLRLKKRSVIESIFSVLKEYFSLVHTRHRSIDNFLVHIYSTLVAYQFRKNKPSITEDFAILNPDYCEWSIPTTFN